MRLLGEALEIIAAFALGCVITAILCSFLSAWGSVEPSYKQNRGGR